MLKARGFYRNGKIELSEHLPEGLQNVALQITASPTQPEDSCSKESLKAEATLLAKKYYQAVHKPQQDKAFIGGVSNIPYGGRVFDEKELINLLDSSLDFWLTAGPYTAKFEQKFCDKFGVRHCSVVNSGSSANMLAFMALTSYKLQERRICKGDEVITIAAGFPTTVNPIIQFGAVPVFIDVTLPTYNIDVNMLDAALSPRTRAVMVAHTLGNPFDIDAVTAFCKKRNLWLIEDNCDALGSIYKGRFTGTFGDLGTSSFYPPHHITMGEGGAVYTSDDTLKILVESFRDWGRDCHCLSGHDNSCRKRFDWQLGTLPKGYDHKYIYSHFGYNLRATDMQAAIGCAQLDKLDKFVELRRKNWQLLYDGLKDLQDVFILPKATSGSQPSWFGFMLTVRPSAGTTRDKVVQHLESRRIQTRMLFAGNYLRHPAFDELRDKPDGYRVVGSLANTDAIMNNSFWLGVYPGMTEEMVEFMVKTVHDAVIR
jgi:CDP-6-deoxy-D-xylo-4-hexulose-3-dehydrase